MKPYSKYPTKISYNGKVWDLDLSYSAVFRVLDLFMDDQLTNIEKNNTALDIFVKDDKHEYQYGILKVIFDYLRPEHKSENKEKYVDIEQDWELILAGFQQTYGIDLNEDKEIHISRFLALLNGLPSTTRLAEIINIRAMEIPENNGKNGKQINKILELKARYALKSDKASFNNGLASLFNTLKERTVDKV